MRPIEWTPLGSWRAICSRSTSPKATRCRRGCWPPAVLGEHQAAGLADRHEARVIRELGPADARLKSAIQTKEHEIDDANARHVDYELAEVGLQIGIVLASVSIIARRRWLLGVSGLAATAGVAFMVAGLARLADLSGTFHR